MGRVPPLAPIPPLYAKSSKTFSTNIEKIMETTPQAEKTVISFNRPTPAWATWVFRLVLWGSGFAIFTICNDTRLPAEFRVTVALYCTGVTNLVHIVTKAIGVKVEDETFKSK